MILRLLALFLLRGSIYGSVGPFAAVLLVQAGLPLVLVGPLAAAAAVITLVAAPAWGQLGDRQGRRRMLVVAFLVGVPAAAGHAAGLLPPLVIAYLAWAAASAAFIPLADSLALARLDGSRSRYARVRVGASTGYVVAALVVGAAISFTAIGWAASGLSAAVLCAAAAAVVAVRLGGELRSGSGVAAGAGGSLFASVRAGVARHPGYLVGLVLVFAAANAPSIFTGPRVAELGGSGWEIGVATAAGTLVEVPAFLVLPWLLPLVGGRRLFVVAALLLAVSGVLAAIAPTPILLVAARLLFGAGYAWMVIPSLGAISAAAPPDGQAGAAALHFASSAAGLLVVALLGLPLVGLTGSVSATLIAAALVAPIGAVVALRGWPAARAARTGPAR